MKQKIVIFDLDNTLNDRDLASLEIGKNLFEKLKNEINFEKIFFIENFLRFDLDKNLRKNKEKYFENISNFFGMEKQKLEDLINFEIQNNVFLKKGVLEFLSFLKKQKYFLGIISNGKYENQIKKIENLGIKKYFDLILISSEIGVKKPDKIFFEKFQETALEKLNFEIKNQNVIYFGDDKKDDFEFFLNSGFGKFFLVGEKNQEVFDEVSQKKYFEIQNFEGFGEKY